MTSAQTRFNARGIILNILSITQGSQEWLAHRSQSLNASDAPAMMGCSPHKSRGDLVRELATGIVPEVSPEQQRRFDNGHRLEALARPHAEQIIGEELFPVVGYLEEEMPGGMRRLSASFDGLTMEEDEGFEHKQLNATLRQVMRPGCTGADLPLMYRVQMQQQCMVSGATRILFVASDWDAEGNLVEMLHCWYETDLVLAQQIRAGWRHLLEDVAAYQPDSGNGDVLKPAKRPDNLPALLVEVQGSVVRSNLEPFRQHALAVIGEIKTELQTDQDFADAEATVKWLKDDVAAQLKAAKQHAMAQAADIDSLFRAIDSVIEAADSKRLHLEKMVKARKEEIRFDIAARAQAALNDHVEKLNQRLGSPWLGRITGAFGEAMKGKKTVATLQDATDTELARRKIEVSELADRMEINRRALVDADGKDWMFLFADFSAVGQKPADDFAAIAQQRIQQHKQAEERRHIAAAAQEAVVAVLPVCKPSPAVVPAAPERSDDGLRIRLGEICQRLGFTVTADFLSSLGISHVAQERTAKMYRAGDFDLICDRIANHVMAVKEGVAA